MKKEDGAMKDDYMSPPGDLWEKVMREHHDVIIAGHPRVQKMVKLITRNYWWPKIA